MYGDSKLMEVLAVTKMFGSGYQERPVAKKCKRAAGNTKKYGTKCRYGGSCDGYKKPCKFAIY